MIRDKFRDTIQKAMTVCLCQRAQDEKTKKFIREHMSYEKMLNVCFNPDYDVISLSESKLEFAVKCLIERFLMYSPDNRMQKLHDLEEVVSNLLIDREDASVYRKINKEQIVKRCTSPIALECVAMYMYDALKERLGTTDATNATIQTFNIGLEEFERLTGNKVFRSEITKKKE